MVSPSRRRGRSDDLAPAPKRHCRSDDVRAILSVPSGLDIHLNGKGFVQRFLSQQGRHETAQLLITWWPAFQATCARPLANYLQTLAGQYCGRWMSILLGALAPMDFQAAIHSCSPATEQDLCRFGWKQGLSEQWLRPENTAEVTDLVGRLIRVTDWLLLPRLLQEVPSWPGYPQAGWTLVTDAMTTCISEVQGVELLRTHNPELYAHELSLLMHGYEHYPHMRWVLEMDIEHCIRTQLKVPFRHDPSTTMRLLGHTEGGISSRFTGTGKACPLRISPFRFPHGMQPLLVARPADNRPTRVMDMSSVAVLRRMSTILEGLRVPSVLVAVMTSYLPMGAGGHYG
jgi:hypothetical protein